MNRYHGCRLESAAVLFIWAGLIGRLTASGSYENLLRPELWVLMLWALLILGLFVETDNAGTCEQDTWVSVKGLLSIQAMGGVDSPHIRAEQISPVDAPANKYLYPRFYW